MRVKENNEKNTVDFAELHVGDCFRYKNIINSAENGLLIKINRKQNAVRLSDGSEYEDMCGIQVAPVNAEVQIID